jgi:hypothetical protein
VVLDDKGKIMKYEPFATGWLQARATGPPADVQVAPTARAGLRRCGRRDLRIAYKK